MSYTSNEKGNFMMYVGLGFSLVGIVLYDPLGLFFQGTGLVVIGLGLICMFVGYKYLSEVERVNKAVENFEKRYGEIMDAETIIPVLGIMTGIIVPVSVFIWLYFESKDKNKTILEISKNIDDPSKIEDLIGMLDERKKEPIDYRRTGVVTLFTGIGLFLFGVFFLGSILKGVGALVAAIGAGQVIAGYLYPRESEELTSAVEKFEEK